MADFLKCRQSSVSRMEKKGSVSRLFRREYEELAERVSAEPVNDAA